MVAFNYADAAAKAKALIEKFGAPGSFIVPGNDGGYDSDGNVIPATPPTTIPGTITPLLQYKAAEIDGEVIRTGDAYVFFDSSTQPAIGNTTTLNGLSYRAVMVNSLTSVGGVRVFTKVQLRR